MQPLRLHAFVERGLRLHLRKAHGSSLPLTEPRSTDPSALSPIQATSVIRSLCQRGSFTLARRVFDGMPERDVVAWTAMVSGYAGGGLTGEALAVFAAMGPAGVGPNAFTVSSVLTACRGRAGAAAAVHAVAVRRGVDQGPYVGNALLDAYASCGGGEGLRVARKVFEEMDERTAASWTTMIAGYTRSGNGQTGIELFRRMLEEGAEFNPFTCSVAIRACASVGSLVFGRQMHAAAVKYGHDTNLPNANSLLDMYCRCMRLLEAKRYFDEMPQKDLITWNTMIAGFERSDSHEALQLFLEMGSQGVQPSCFTFTSIASACANLAVLYCGQQVHGAIVSRGFGENLQLANALIDMYAKCGSVSDARKIFSEMTHKDLLSWTSLMIGYGINGYGKEAVDLFNEMVDLSIRPDHVVFIGVISACSHAGLVDEGLKYFNSMSREYNILPGREVYGCVVDLLGRAGRLCEAYKLIETMPAEPDESIWGALLGACKMHKDVGLGRWAAQRMLNLKPVGAKTYVILSNIYAAGREWGEFAETRRLLRGMGSQKEAGMSWIEVRNKVCSFVAGDRSSPHVRLVDEVLELLVQHMNEDGDGSDLDGFQHGF